MPTPLMEDRSEGEVASAVGNPAAAASPMSQATTGSADDGVTAREVLATCLREAEATTGQRQEDCFARAALLAWDLGDAAAARAHALRAPGHPVLARLIVAQALAEGTTAALDGAAEAARAAGVSAELAEGYLYRAGDARRASAAAEPDETRAVALALAGDWKALAERLASSGERVEAGRAPLTDLFEAAHLHADRLGQPARAAELLESARGRDPYPTERLLDLAASVPSVDVAALLAERLALIGDSDADERQATAFLLADELERAGRRDEAAQALAGVDPAGSGFARLVLHARRRLAFGRGAFAEAAAAHRHLAGAGSPAMRRAHLRRAAELFDAHLGDPVAAEKLYAELFSADPADTMAGRALERLRLRSDDPAAAAALVHQLELVARAQPSSRAAALRRAAAVAESRLGDLDTAVQLAHEAHELDGSGAAIERLLRLYRRTGERSRLAWAYRRAAGQSHDDRLASAYLVAAGCLELAAGATREAEEALREAARRAPEDVGARLALAAILRRSGRWRDLAETLDGLRNLFATDGLRAGCLRELGRITAQRLGDPRGARAYLERALELAPEDAGILEALAALVGDSGDWTQAVALRERAVALVSAGPAADSGRAAGLLLEIGDIEEHQRKDDEAARRAYERALALDEPDGKDDSTHPGRPLPGTAIPGQAESRAERMIQALRALASLHRKAKRSGELLRVLRRELELPADNQRRLTLLLEIARTADQGENDTAAALEGYRAALAIDPTSSPALAGLERICRRDGKWELLADALRPAPRTPRNLRTLGEALEKLERWPELAEVRRQEMDGAAVDRKEAARAAMSLAQLLEEKLGDVDGAIRVYRRCVELEPADVRPLRLLAKLLETRSAWPELVDVLEKELVLLAAERPGGPAAASDTARRVALLHRIGEIRQTKLDRSVEAASAFEAVLEIDAKNVAALNALEGIYQRLARDGDLLRTLERKAEITTDPAARAEDFGRIADIRERRGDIDAALACYREAFLADPANRNTFTALERLCYKRERWREAMELYDSAIQLVESGTSRAYRLGDLYARKGQIQLQYLGQPSEAAASYLRCIELDPENETSLRFLESIYSSASDWENLIKAYEKRADLIADDERRIETLRRAARVAAGKRRDMAEAARLYERILVIDPTDGESLDSLERYHEKVKDWNKLVGVLTMRMSTAPAGDAAVALLMRIASICEEGLRDEGRAIEQYRRILEIAPGSKDALDALGRIYESTEKWPEFVDVTRRLIRITTDRNMKALLYFKCGSVMESKFGKEEDAIRYYDAAIKTSPSCLPAVHGLRDLYLRRKDWAKVLHSLELEVKLWQDDKERAGVFAQIGHIYGDFLHDTDRALSYYESALQVDPDCLPANRSLFEIFFARSDWQRAAPLGQALAQKAMREGDPTERSEFYRKRGIVAWHARDLRAAAESFIIALEIKPENLVALDDLGRLARAEPDAYDFPATYRELEKIYRKRDDTAPHLARVLVAGAAMLERAGDLDGAERGYREGLVLSPGDFTVLASLVDLHVNMRRFTHAADTIVRFLDAKPGPPREVRVPALLRLAEIHSEGEMDAHRAASILREVLRIEPAHQDAHYRLAQELFVAGRFAEARQHIEQVIEIAAAPGQTAPSPEALARYYYYLGRILEAQGGDGIRAAGSQYRRAAEYDPAYAPTALALGKRSVNAGDRRSAENTLIQAAHAAIKKGGQRAAVPLQRGLARILLAAGERLAAIEAYRGILAVEPEGADDRVALAEIYAMEDVPKAIVECHRVLDRDLRQPPAYRLLASLYERMGEPERAARVNGIFELLGYAEETDRILFAQARSRQLFTPRRSVLSDELRNALLLPAGASSPGGKLLDELYRTVAAEVSQLYAMPHPGLNLVPAAQIDDPGFKVAITDQVRLFGIEVDVYVGDEVLGGMAVLQFPRPALTMSRALFQRPDRERRFLLGRAFESLRGMYAPILRLSVRERTEVGTLLRSLLLPDAERPGPAQEFVRQLPRKTQKALERFVIPGLTAAALPGPPPPPAFGAISNAPPPPAAKGSELLPNADAWLAALALAEDRAGILACDDFAAAARALAILSGEELAVTPDGAVALGAVPGGSDLVRYFLSDDYHRLRLALSEPVVKPVT